MSTRVSALLNPFQSHYGSLQPHTTLSTSDTCLHYNTAPHHNTTATLCSQALPSAPRHGGELMIPVVHLFSLHESSNTAPSLHSTHETSLHHNTTVALCSQLIPSAPHGPNHSSVFIR